MRKWVVLFPRASFVFNAVVIYIHNPFTYNCYHSPMLINWFFRWRWYNIAVTLEYRYLFVELSWIKSQSIDNVSGITPQVLRKMISMKAALVFLSWRYWNPNRISPMFKNRHEYLFLNSCWSLIHSVRWRGNDCFSLFISSCLPRKFDTILTFYPYCVNETIISAPFNRSWKWRMVFCVVITKTSTVVLQSCFSVHSIQFSLISQSILCEHEKAIVHTCAALYSMCMGVYFKERQILYVSRSMIWGQ